MIINPYINFAGNCEEAFQFYAQLFGGKIEFLQRWADSPMGAGVGPDWKQKIMHVRFRAGNNLLMGSDAEPAHFKPPQGFQVTLSFDESAEADRVFAALSQGGSVVMPIQETYWAARFGMTVDRFGIPWMINCDKK
ncbi:MAG: VOC family protein [Terriglobales bacterium]